jgi:DNA-binding response OmpR family regulator
MKMLLVISTDPALGPLLAARLNFQGVEVLTATDPEFGLRTALDCQPDLVVIEFTMPGAAGLAVAHRLWAEAPGIPFVVVAASPEPWLQETVKHLGARELVTKTADAEALLACVDRLLHGSGGAGSLTPPGSPPAFAEARQAPAPAAPAPPSPTVAATPSPPPPVPAPSAGRITGTNKILIVEDDRAIAMALAVRLRAAGQETLFAYDALSGVDMAVRHRPDLVLLDIGLPAGSGLSVAERIRALVPKLTPIIFLTASRQPGLRDRALQLGAADFIEKPYEASRLIAAIEQALHPVPT